MNKVTAKVDSSLQLIISFISRSPPAYDEAFSLHTRPIGNYVNSTQVRLEDSWKTIPNDPIQNFNSTQVRLKVYPFQEDDILVDTETEFRVKLSITINRELVYELARLGSAVKVLSPPSLIQQLKTFLQDTLNQY